MDGKHSFKYDYGNIRLSMQKIIDYPFHWHAGIEIILVLKGSICLEVYKDPDMLTSIVMKENDIFVTGDDEIHRLYSSDDSNVALLLQIDKAYIRTIFDFSDNLEFDYLFYTYGVQEREVLQRIKGEVQLLFSLIIEDELHKNEKNIFHLTNNLLFLLIDNFEIINRKLSRDGYSRKHYERFMRITNYIQNNVSNKNLLSDIAKVEYLNPAYISHELKKNLDFNFQQAVNFYRIRNAICLLLNSNHNISDIAYECGFSASRYFYKHFSKIHSEGPFHFRKVYRNRFKNIDFVNAYEEIITTYDYLSPAVKMKAIENDVFWLDVNMASEGTIIKSNWKDSLSISNIDDVSTTEMGNSLLVIQNEIGFRALKVHQLFSDLDKTPLTVSKSLQNITLYLRILQKNHLEPIIVLNALEFNTNDKVAFIEQFLSHAEAEFGKKNMKNWGFELIEGSNTPEYLIKLISKYTSNISFPTISIIAEVHNPLQDTIFKATEILSKFCKNSSFDPLLPMDPDICIDEPCVFKGCNGLITSNGLLKPSFHACSFLSLLGDELLIKGSYYVVTRKAKSLQILLFNHLPLSVKESDLCQAFSKTLYDEKLINKINIRLKNINGIYKATSFTLDNKEPSIYNILMELPKPVVLNEYDKKVLNKISAPHISFEIITDKSFSYNISLNPYGIKLIILDPV